VWIIDTTDAVRWDHLALPHDREGHFEPSSENKKRAISPFAFRCPARNGLVRCLKIHADRLAGFWTPQEINRVLTLDRLVAEIASASIDQLHRYIELLFEPAKRRGKEIS